MVLELLGNLDRSMAFLVRTSSLIASRLVFFVKNRLLFLSCHNFCSCSGSRLRRFCSSHLRCCSLSLCVSFLFCAVGCVDRRGCGQRSSNWNNRRAILPWLALQWA